MSSNDSWTIGRLLRWTTDYLQEHGSDSGRLDAEILLSQARQCERIELYTAFDQEPSEAERATFRDLVRRRAEGVPVAYLVGHREFYSLSFQVTPDVLIPRPETEFLVIAIQDLVKQQAGADGKTRAWKIADVGTGSGIVAICIAHQLPAAQLWATDISHAALDVAAENCRRHDVAERVQRVLGDLLEPLAADLRFDFVVSNPPYVSQAEFAELCPTVRDYEPRQALLAGPTGAEVIQRLVEQAVERLEPHGWLVMEISPMIQQRVQEIIRDSGRFDQVDSITDLAGLPRVVQARLAETAGDSSESS